VSRAADGELVCVGKRQLFRLVFALQDAIVIQYQALTGTTGGRAGMILPLNCTRQWAAT